MINFKEKSQVFILGMMAGLIVAGGFFILKLDDYFKELKFYKHIAETFYLHSKNKESAVKSIESDPTEVIKITKNTGKKKYTAKNDSIPTEKNFVLNAEVLNSQFAKDSSLFDSDETEEIIVKKDELLSNKTIEVINLNTDESRTNTSDSLLQNLSGIRDDRNSSKQFFNIELWQSPLNYRGYKLSKNKIVVYGIALADDIKIFKMNNFIYFKNASTIYKMEQSGDFKPYKNITDPSILEKLR